MGEIRETQRLALDLGSNSIGWILFKVDQNGWPTSIIKSGVRIFSNSRSPKNNIPNSVERRQARGMRRRRDRLLQRKKSVLNRLRSLSLLPSNDNERQKFAVMDPYLLRHKALTEKLSTLELGRVLLHFAQRRGFLSNRKNIAKDEGGKALGGKIAELQSAITNSNCLTLGSFLYQTRIAKGLSVRMRADTDWYPTRGLYRNEFKAIRDAQSKFHSYITQDHWIRLEKTLFAQRGLKPQIPGKCLFKPELDRCYRALPSYQRFRVLQQVANLRVQRPGQVAERLMPDQRALLLEKLFSNDKLKFEEARKLLGLEGTTFNLEAGRNSFKAVQYLFGDRTSSLLSKKGYFGKLWGEFSANDKDRLTELVINEADDTVIREHLNSRYTLNDEQLENIVALTEDDFERGYSDFSGEIAQELTRAMLDDNNLNYADAVSKLGYHHSDFRPDVLSDRLPHYAEILKSSVRPDLKARVKEEREFGKIANPTVHVALNQLRILVNALLERYGSVQEIVVEVARDLPLGEEGLSALKREQDKNEKQNNAWRELLVENGQRDTFNNRLRLRLWHELSESPLGRACPYSGEIISIARLFSTDIEIDHILPKSRTFSNHHSNLTLCIRNANRFKKERSPYEAFSSSDSPYRWTEILDRIANLPLNKQRKFTIDAMERFSDENSFLERQLNDTRFISKATCKYLQSICSNVMVSRGGLTAFIRSEINLNRLLSTDGKKNRNDHRHHAVDAFIVGLTPSKTIRQVERIVRTRENNEASDRLSLLIAEFEQHLKAIIVSHRPDHSADTKFFEETNYGQKEPGVLVIRSSVNNLSDPDSVLSPEIAQFMRQRPSLRGEELGRAIFERFGAKKVRILKNDSSAIKIIHPRNNPRFHKWIIPIAINRIEFWQAPQNRGTDQFQVISYSSYEASRKSFVSKQPHPAARKVLTIRKGDYLRIEESSGVLRTVVVESLKPANRTILFTDHNIAKNENARGRSVSFGGLLSKKLRVVHCDVLGIVRDSGLWWADESKNSRNSERR